MSDEMADETNGVEFPTHADEEQMVYGLTISQAMILFGTLGLIILTRQIILFLVVGYVAWKSYGIYKDKGQSNILIQLLYRWGLFIPKSHLFPEPTLDSFRE